MTSAHTYPPNAMVGAPPNVTRKLVALSHAHSGREREPNAARVVTSRMFEHEPFSGTPARSVGVSKVIRSATVESANRISLMAGVRVKPVYTHVG